MKRHTIIVGTGRAGTSFLVRLLTNVGLDTGYSKNNIVENNIGRAGLEQDIKKSNAPYIIKNPNLSLKMDWVFENYQIDYVFMPMRDLFAAAESRRFVSKGQPRGVPGGVWCDPNHPEKQERMLLDVVYRVNLATSKHQVPFILINYPKLTKDPKYLYEKLKPILKGLDYATFEKEFNNLVNPSLVHQFGENDK